jgi:hypothetical protein
MRQPRPDLPGLDYVGNLTPGPSPRQRGVHPGNGHEREDEKYEESLGLRTCFLKSSLDVLTILC